MAWARCVSGALASLLGDLLCFCSMAASRPLLLAYLLFFSPYLLAALSFLGPLLVSTCFLILALLTVSPYLRESSPPPLLPPPPPPDGGRGPFGNTLRLVVGMLDPSAGGETELLPPQLEFNIDSGEDLPRKETPCSAEFQGRKVPTREEVDIPVSNPSKSAIKSRDRGELPDRNLTGEISSPPKRPTPRSKGSISRSESDGSSKLLRLRRSSSSSSTSAAAAAAAELSRVASARGWSAAGTKGAQPLAMSSSGSMRKEKEWRRTLACKLFEERMIADGGEEGMDLLWETYEQGDGSSSSSKKVSHSRHDKDRSRKQESIKAKRSGELKVEADDGDGDEEDEEEATTGRLCCLQALRFSTSKMGLGVGRSSLLRKVSKAMKGVGVFRPRSGRKTG